MFYSDLLCKQIEECSDRIVSLQSKVRNNSDPKLKKIILLEIANTEVHILSLRKLKFLFDNAAYSN
jgi:hypothetical protein